MKISVVGNARSIFDNYRGRLIDSADIVIRFNRGVPERQECQGKKTHILVFMNPGSKNAFPPGLEYWHTKDFPERKHLEEVLDAPPSDGAVALEKVKNDYPSAEVNVFGFDWKKTESFWRPDRPTTKHNYANEEQYCRQLIEDMNWNLYQ